tara:strand:- start:310 stop:669 length:360 start_codon:yes stop_codon:yes gene_type:complete
MTTENIRTRILRDLEGDLTTDSNHATRRMFRCWLDGSYLGEDHYRTNLKFIKGNNHDRKAMRSFIINEFCKYTAQDAQCSAGYAQSVIANHFSTDFLNKLNDALIDEAIEFGAESEEAA